MQHKARIYRTGFPDLGLTIDQLLTEGDAVMVRWTASGTHTGVLMAMADVEARQTIAFTSGSSS